jgi:stress-induced morphogen
LDNKELLIDLENALCTKMRPTFLAITDPDADMDGDIQVLISCIAFKGKSIQERVSMVFGVIKQYVPKAMDDRLIVVQCYDGDQIVEILDTICKS